MLLGQLFTENTVNRFKKQNYNCLLILNGTFLFIDITILLQVVD